MSIAQYVAAAGIKQENEHGELVVQVFLTHLYLRLFQKVPRQHPRKLANVGEAVPLKCVNVSMGLKTVIKPSRALQCP